jgi:hydrogenase nickel incorporation protein HypA/HybF
MDERELANQIVDLVDQAAHRNQLRKVTSVHLAVGAGRVLDVWQLGRIFGEATLGTVAEKARLSVELLPLRHHCSKCGSDFDSESLTSSCSHCGHSHTENISGDEVRLLEIEADEPVSQPSSHKKENAYGHGPNPRSGTGGT